MPVYRDKAKGRWRFEFDRRFNGRRYRFTKLLPKGWSRDQAERYDTAKSAGLAAQAAGIESKQASIGGAVQLYLEHRVPDLRDRRKTVRDLATLFDYIDGQKLEDLPEISRRYVKDARGKLASGTVAKRLGLLKAAVRYAYRRHGYGDRDYTERMVVPVPNNSRQRYERLKDLNRLWKAFEDEEARALFKMVFYMGLRWRAELLPRKPDDVVKVDEEPWLRIGTTKNGTPRMVPVHPAIRPCLKFLPFKHGDTWFYERWQEAAAKAGMKDFRPHDLRHSLASEIISRSGTLEEVAAALHHQSLSASRRYSHLYPERLKRVLWGIGRQKTPHRSRK